MSYLSKIVKNKLVYLDRTRTADISNNQYDPYHRYIQLKETRFSNRDVYISIEETDDALSRSIGIDKNKWRAHDETVFDEVKDANRRLR